MKNMAGVVHNINLINKTERVVRDAKFLANGRFAAFCNCTNIARPCFFDDDDDDHHLSLIFVLLVYGVELKSVRRQRAKAALAVDCQSVAIR